MFVYSHYFKIFFDNRDRQIVFFVTLKNSATVLSRHANTGGHDAVIAVSTLKAEAIHGDDAAFTAGDPHVANVEY